MGVLRIERVEAPDDPRLLPFRDVKDPEWLKRRDVFLAEGRTVIRKLLERPRFETRSLLVTEPALRSLEDLLKGAGFPIYRVRKEILEALAGVRFHQGCVALVARPEELAFPAMLPPDARCCLVLENISDPDNIGGLFRNAAVLGADAVAIGPGCSHPLYRKATRTSMGATLEVPFGRLRSWPEGLEDLRRAGFSLVALTPRRGAEDLDRFVSTPLPPRIALLLGDEGYGLSEEALECCDRQVRIAMSSGADSLNVATTAAIALHRLAPETLGD